MRNVDLQAPTSHGTDLAARAEAAGAEAAIQRRVFRILGDASRVGWGALCKDSLLPLKLSGQWAAEEQQRYAADPNLCSVTMEAQAALNLISVTS